MSGRRTGAAAALLALAVAAGWGSEAGAAFCRALDAVPAALALVDAARPSEACPGAAAPEVSREAQWLLLPPADWAGAWDGASWRGAVLRVDAAGDAEEDLPSLEAVLCAAAWDAESVAWATRPAVADAAVAVASPVRVRTAAGAAWRWHFDLAPWLADDAARAAFAEFGLAVRVAGGSGGTVALRGDSALFRASVEAQPVQTGLFAVGHVDSAPRDEPKTPDHVFWEQGGATVGKIVLNGNDGSECRAIVEFPEELAGWPEGGVGRLVAKFDAEIQDWSGVENLILYPLRPGTRLERRRWEDCNLEVEEPPCPGHGPSWSFADGPAPGMGGDAVPWCVPMASFHDGAMGDGPWFAEWGVTGEVVRVKNTYGTATFDLTALWQDPGAREALSANGAVVLLDPAHWPRVLEKGLNTRVNLYRPDIYVRLERNKFSWMEIEPADALPVAFGAPVPAGGGALACPVAGLDPAAPAALQFSGTLGSCAGWRDDGLVEDSPVLLEPGGAGAGFWRLAVPGAEP